MKLDLLLDSLKSITVSKLDDAVDRLHYLYTMILLVFFVICVGLQQTFKYPLTCKPMANFPETWVDYSRNYCYISGTFHTNDASDWTLKHDKQFIGYYQWIPYVLTLQALSFYLPHLFYLIASQSGLLDIRQIVDRCCKAEGKPEDERSKEVKEIAEFIFESTTLRHEKEETDSPRSLGNFLVYAYLLSKALNLLNLLANIYLLNKFIGGDDSSWALTVVQNAINGVYWDTTGYFPRVSYCDVILKHTGQPITYRIQCLLMINILIEKVYTALYFWFVFLLLPTAFNLLWSFFQLLIQDRPRAYIISKPFFESDGEIDKQVLRKFCWNYLSRNGCLMIQFIEDHAGSVVASQLLKELIKLWKDERKSRLRPITLVDGVLKEAELD